MDRLIDTFDNDRVPNVIYIPAGASASGRIGQVSFPYSSQLTGLVQNTTYYIRAYAINDNSPNIGYSATLLTATTSAGEVPTVSTQAATSIATASVLLPGNVSLQGTSAVTVRGFELGTNSSFAAGTFTRNQASGGGLGAFSLSVVGLSSDTIYYYRSYAISSVGTGYGNVLSFRTLQPLQSVPPVVVTEAPSQITSTSFTITGSVSSQGSSAVTERGFELSPSQNFVPFQKFPSAQAGVGTFSTNLVSATAATTYYYRAYAISSVTPATSPAYGSTRSVTTLMSVPIPSVSTTQISASTLNPILRGNIQGGDSTTISSRGFRVGLNSDLKTYTTFSRSSPLTSLDIEVSGLATGMWYFYCAFATNAQGTGLGEVRAFKMVGENAGSLSIATAATRALSSNGAASLIVGITLGGSGSISLLARGVGPTLSQFGISNSMPDPTVTVYSQGSIVGYNDDWVSQIRSLFPGLGAFDLPLNSRDATVPITLNPGNYTFTIAPIGSSQSGVVLAELYILK